VKKKDKANNVLPFPIATRPQAKQDPPPSTAFFQVGSDRFAIHMWCESLPAAPRRPMAQSPGPESGPVPPSSMNSSKAEPDYTPEELQELDEDLAMSFNRNLLANQKAEKDDNDKPESPRS
jgi:hypothetical protein